MAGKSHDHAMPADQHRMIVSRVGREHGTGRERTGRIGHLLPFACPANPVPFRIDTNSAEQADKSGKKEPKNYRDPQDRMPLDQERLPETEHHDEIGPEKELGIVPFPRRESNHRTSKKDDCCRKEQQPNSLFCVTRKRFGGNQEVDQNGQRSRQKEAEILQPEPPGSLVRAGHPVQFPADGARLSEPGDKVCADGGRNEREQNQSNKMATPIWISKQEPPEQKER